MEVFDDLDLARGLSSLASTSFGSKLLELSRADTDGMSIFKLSCLLWRPGISFLTVSNLPSPVGVGSDSLAAANRCLTPSYFSPNATNVSAAALGSCDDMEDEERCLE